MLLSESHAPEAKLADSDGAGINSLPPGMIGMDYLSGEGINAMDKAAFGMGCFWGSEAAFRQVPGVVDAAVGYMGGTLKNPTYRDVCTGRTGHAEAVQLEYDP